MHSNPGVAFYDKPSLYNNVPELLLLLLLYPDELLQCLTRSCSHQLELPLTHWRCAFTGSGMLPTTGQAALSRGGPQEALRPHQPTHSATKTQ